METSWSIDLGLLRLTEPVLTTWGIMLVLATAAWMMSRRLTIEPRPWQAAIEGIVQAIEQAVTDVADDRGRPIVPFIGTLWIFIGVANLVGVIPGLHAPTGHLSVTAALAALVFGSVHWFGIRAEGLGGYLRHYVQPVAWMLPFHLIGEVSRTMALAVRLFGNIMSLEMAALLVLLVAGFLAPVPLLALHILEALIQAYIFGILALLYIASGLQTHALRRTAQRNDA